MLSWLPITKGRQLRGPGRPLPRGVLHLPHCQATGAAITLNRRAQARAQQGDPA